MAALQIGGELDLIDRHERHVEIARHRLDGRHPIARLGRLDLLFAGDQRHRVRADPIDDLVVDLARQQPQRQPDHAAGMGQHALDRQMGLAGVGRSEHGGDAGARGALKGRRRCERGRESYHGTNHFRKLSRCRPAVSQNVTPMDRASDRLS